MASSELLQHLAHLDHTLKCTVLFDTNGQRYGWGSTFFKRTSECTARKILIDGMKFRILSSETWGFCKGLSTGWQRFLTVSMYYPTKQTLTGKKKRKKVFRKINFNVGREQFKVVNVFKDRGWKDSLAIKEHCLLFQRNWLQLPHSQHPRGCSQLSVTLVLWDQASSSGFIIQHCTQVIHRCKPRQNTQTCKNKIFSKLEFLRLKVTATVWKENPGIKTSNVFRHWCW